MMQKIVFKSGSDEGKSVYLDDELYLGRFSKKDKKNPCNVFIKDIEVSRRHLRIFKSDGHVYLQDLNSTNGTSLQGIKIRPGIVYSIKNADQILLGATVVEFLTDTEEQNDEEKRFHFYKRAN
ncbi:MAG: FHA domain-containing protein [Candidatus Heimdallarchaeota archaeon]